MSLQCGDRRRMYQKRNSENAVGGEWGEVYLSQGANVGQHNLGVFYSKMGFRKEHSFVSRMQGTFLSEGSTLSGRMFEKAHHAALTRWRADEIWRAKYMILAR